jgi:hypothetical protein
MLISEIIAALTVIRDKHGDLHVLHRDDWRDFLVESVSYEPASDVSWGGDREVTPAHVLITGDLHGWNSKGEMKNAWKDEG